MAYKNVRNVIQIALKWLDFPINRKNSSVAGGFVYWPPSAVKRLSAPVSSVRHLIETFFEQQSLTWGSKPPP